MSDRLTAPTLVATRGYEHERFSVAAPVTFNWPPAIMQAISQPSGARYYRCALQINTPVQGRFKGFDSKHPRHSPAYKRDYGLALAQKCKKVGIDVIGICDHNTVDYIDAVHKELTQEGIQVFPGFEVASTEGLHLLCLFDPRTTAEEVDHVITELRLPPKERWVTSVGGVPKQSPLSFPEIIEHIQRRRRGICIAAHIDRENGLLFECAKTTRVQYFTDGNLLAGQISGSRKELMPFHRKVVTGELNHYRREHPLALLNCLDVYNLKDLAQTACSSWIKMSSPSIEGLWQAFLDPDSRLRLLTEEASRSRTRREAEKVELIALSWEGGFLNECGIHFNKNLNCLIGGRGTGKSSIIESLRYVLEQKPLGALAQEAHQSMIKEVIKSATKISLLVRTHHPAPAYYRIERTISDPPLAPVVFDEHGARSELKVFDLLPQIDLFGQHEISEIALHPEKQLDLLKRFRPKGWVKYEAERNEQLELLALNRENILRVQRDLQTLEEKLGRLPGLEEKLRRFETHGLEAKLHEQTQLTREEAYLKASREKVASFRKPLELMRQKLELESASLDGKAAGELPNADLMKKIALEQQQFLAALRQGFADLEELVEQSQRQLLAYSQQWETRRRARQDEYQKTLRQLHHEAIDGQAYLRLRRELEDLAPLRLQYAQHQQKLRELENKRSRALRKLHEACKQIYKLDNHAAKKVSEALAGNVRVSVTQDDGRELLYKKLRGLKIGVREDFLPKLKSLENFSLMDFIAHLRAGATVLSAQYELPAKIAEKVAQLDERLVLQLEETPPTTLIRIEHNVAASIAEPVWRGLDEVSTGQRATAILLMLFPQNGAPLVIDQPEDDLDNRFIAEQVIPKLREEKQRRQFIFATHNANLPVLGDAELIVALEARGDSQLGQAQILESNLGAIDRESVKLCVEQVLEGGKQAFEKRRAKYGF
ncbi:MAG: TrlF family AAA-like ATPase [candidate division KSB1 bacterium]